MSRRKLVLTAMLSTLALVAQPARAQEDPAVLKDLTSVIALQGQPCGQVVSATKQGDNDYIATCKDGSRYRVYVNEGRVIVQKQ